jgi:hypothetical protein
MRMVEEYLRAIGVLLPRETREDIVAELRDVVLTELEAREAQLGRPLTEDEVEATLRRVGHPLAVAARYGNEPQHVVGPRLYPFWFFGVKAAVAVQAAVACVVLAAHVLTGQPVSQALRQAIASIVGGALTLIGVATVVAWLVERRKMSLPYFDHWRVRDLRIFDVARWNWNMVARWSRSGQPDGGRWSSRLSSRAGKALGRIAWGVVLLLWWVGALHVYGSGLGSLGIDEAQLKGFDWQVLKTTLFLPVIIYACVTIVSGTASITRPQLLRLEGLLDLLCGTGLVVITWWLAYVSPLAPSVHVNGAMALIDRTRTTLEHGPPFSLPALITPALAIFAAVGMLRIAAGVWKLLARRGSFRACQ